MKYKILNLVISLFKNNNFMVKKLLKLNDKMVRKNKV
jgi:hypothetical protein